jgi:hypothetical protein
MGGDWIGPQRQEPQIVWEGQPPLINERCRVVVGPDTETGGLAVKAEVLTKDAMGVPRWTYAVTHNDVGPSLELYILREMAKAAAVSDLSLLAAAALLE